MKVILEEGKGIFYFANGERMMGDYLNGKPIGKHVMLTRYGEIKIENYKIINHIYNKYISLLLINYCSLLFFIKRKDNDIFILKFKKSMIKFIFY